MVHCQKHFDYLQEMGIAIWQRRSLVSHNESVEEPIEQQSSVKVELTNLLGETLFTDILISLKIEHSTVQQINDNTLNLGHFIWCFSEKNEIHFTRNVLKTPLFDSLTKPANKRALYQVFSAHQLI